MEVIRLQQILNEVILKERQTVSCNDNVPGQQSG
jgi:hypothetical protein